MFLYCFIGNNFTCTKKWNLAFELIDTFSLCKLSWRITLLTLLVLFSAIWEIPNFFFGIYHFPLFSSFLGAWTMHEVKRDKAQRWQSECEPVLWVFVSWMQRFSCTTARANLHFAVRHHEHWSGSIWKCTGIFTLPTAAQTMYPLYKQHITAIYTLCWYNLLLFAFNM